MCAVLCKYNFCEGPISGMRLHRKSIISQVLHLKLLITVLITASPLWVMCQLQVPSGTINVFKNLTGVVKSKWKDDVWSHPSFFSSLPLFLVFLGSSIAVDYKLKDQEDCMFQCTLYWFLFSTLPKLKLTWNHHSTIFIFNVILFVVLWDIFAIFF